MSQLSFLIADHNIPFIAPLLREGAAMLQALIDAETLQTLMVTQMVEQALALADEVQRVTLLKIQGALLPQIAAQPVATALQSLA